MRKTALRTPQMHAKYESAPKDPDFMKNAPSIIEYTYWRVIDNTFPYDNVAKKHHLLIPRRQFANFIEMNKMEAVEFETIISVYIEDYDHWGVNTAQAMSVPNWFHIHLIKWKKCVL